MLAGLGAGLAAIVAGAIVAGFLPALMPPVAGEGAGARRPTADVRDWILTNVEPVTALLVPQEVADDLVRHGHQAGRLLVYDGSGSGADWQCCRFLVTLGRPTESAEQTLPPQLRPASQRSRVLAVFASGDRRAEIREIFPGDPTTAGTALARDRTLRQDLAVHLAANSRLHLSPAARVPLLAGEVDARVLVALARVARRHAVTVTEFPVHPGEATTGVPRRAVTITSIAERPVHPHTAATKDVQRFLRQQIPPYRPHALPITRDGGLGMLTIWFRAPNPLGLRVPPLA